MKTYTGTHSPHIKNVGIKGWTSFKDALLFKCENINLIIGPNNSGKSNFLKLMTFLKEIFYKMNKTNRSSLHTDEISINLDDILTIYSKSNIFTIDLDTIIDWTHKNAKTSFTFELNKEKTQIRLAKIKIWLENKPIFDIINFNTLTIYPRLINEIILKSHRFHKMAKEYFDIRKKATVLIKNITDPKLIKIKLSPFVADYNLKYNESIGISDLIDNTLYLGDMLYSSKNYIGKSNSAWESDTHFNATKYMESDKLITNNECLNRNRAINIKINFDIISMIINSNFKNSKNSNKISVDLEDALLNSKLIDKDKDYCEIPDEYINIVKDLIFALTKFPINYMSHFTYLDSELTHLEKLSNNLPLNKIKKLLNNSNNDIFKIHIEKYLKHMAIGEQIKITSKQNGQTLQILKSGKWIPERFLGRGGRKLLYLILDIVYNGVIRYGTGPFGMLIKNINYHKILMEEPEANLHPALQAKLADLIVEANNTFGIQFIIETHSEYLVRKLQYLVAKQECKPESVKIFYLNFNEDLKTTVMREIGIAANGTLTQPFGPGFFDEADKLTLDLFLLSGGGDN